MSADFNHPLSYERPFKFPRHLVGPLEINNIIAMSAINIHSTDCARKRRITKRRITKRRKNKTSNYKTPITKGRKLQKVEKQKVESNKILLFRITVEAAESR